MGRILEDGRAENCLLIRTNNRTYTSVAVMGSPVEAMGDGVSPRHTTQLIAPYISQRPTPAPSRPMERLYDQGGR